VKDKTPFFVWFNTTRMHVFTHLKKESYGKTGKGIEADGMVEHDGHVGELLDELDKLGIADDTIVVYTTDNGAEIALWPDGGMTPFKSEKGTTWEGGFRVPMMVRWPGVVKAGVQSNEIISLLDWFPTLCAAAGAGDIVGQMKKGFKAGKKTFKVHLDGHDFGPYFRGETQTGPRDAIYYFDQGGNLNAIRVHDWKLSFAEIKGNIATGVRETPGWALIANLRMDPFERGMEEGGGAIDFLARQLWVIVPAMGKVKEFFADFEDYPHQDGSALNAGGINYKFLKEAKAMKTLKSMERVGTPG
jgi:arylsulfatase